MTKHLNLPEPQPLNNSNRLNAPSAARNSAAICAVLQQHAPLRGRALELASGTGQHIAQFAKLLPELLWQPSEPDERRFESIRAWCAGCGNVLPPIPLDATQTGWSAHHSGFDLIYLSNLLHLIPWEAAQTLITESAEALAPRGRFILYGPFMRNGHLTSEGDRRFHNSLITKDPAVGYKDIEDVERRAKAAGLTLRTRLNMPANNIALICEKPEAG